MYYLYKLYWNLKHPIATIKRYIRIKSFPIGTLVEDCRYHPCIITETDGEGGIDVISLANYKSNGCSLFHCGIEKLTPERTIELIKIYNKDGDKGIALNAGWKAEDWEAFKKEWG